MWLLVNLASRYNIYLDYEKACIMEYIVSIAYISELYLMRPVMW